jgi:hypothetical protein
VIDLLNLSISYGDIFVTPCQHGIADNSDARRLFGNKQLEMSRARPSYFFEDDVFGPTGNAKKRR